MINRDKAAAYNALQIARADIDGAVVTGLTERAQLALGLVVDGMCGPATRRALREAQSEPPPAGPLPPIVDRKMHARPRYKPYRRRWVDVTGICLHQTACRLGERPSRWDTVGAHWGVTAAGVRIRLHPSNMRVGHAQAWNAQTVGIEVDGLYPGIVGDPRTLWDDPSTPRRERASVLTDMAVEATRQIIRDIVAEVAEHGGDVRALVAHRQSSINRRNDPGSEIWQRIALPMKAELGLRDGGESDHTFEVGGRPIPEAWDPSRKGISY